MSLLCLSYVETRMTLIFMTSCLPIVMHEARLSLEQAEITSSLLQLGGAAGSYAFGCLLDRQGVAALAFGFASVSILLGMPTAAIAGSLVSGGQAGINAFSGTLYPTYMRGSGSGWAFGIGRIGSVVRPVIRGFVLALHLSVESLFMFVAVPLACVAAAVSCTLSPTPENIRHQGV